MRRLREVNCLHIAQPDEGCNPGASISVMLYIVLNRKSLLIILFSYVLPSVPIVDLYVCPLEADFFWRMVFYFNRSTYASYVYFNRALQLTVAGKGEERIISEVRAKTCQQEYIDISFSLTMTLRSCNNPDLVCRSSHESGPRMKYYTTELYS